MRDHTPIAMHQRLLILRQVPGFADADLAELASIAENLVETTFDAGELVSAPAARVAAVHVVVDGMLAAGSERWGPSRLFGAFEVIAGRAVTRSVVALTPTRTLRLAAADVAEVLEDNHTILSSARRAIARRLLALVRADRHPTSRTTVGAPPDHPLGLVERLIALRQQTPFATSRIQALAAIAQSADEVWIDKGTLIHDNGADADSMLLVVEGLLRTSGLHPRVYGPGDAVGILEVLGETGHDASVVTLTDTRVLRVPAIAVLDVMEDHTDFALGMISTLACELLDAVGGASADPPAILDHTN